jgi:small subunit ribosomal protein S7
MSRKKRDFTREILPDPKYKDVVVTKVVNIMMISGKKSIAETALYDAFDVIQKKIQNENPIDVFYKALGNIKPVVEVRSRRVGGATYQVPTEVRSQRAESLAIRWHVTSANDRSERSLAERMANELLDAYSNRGIAVKKKEDTHRMAEANKAFSHFKW